MLRLDPVAVPGVEHHTLTGNHVSTGNGQTDCTTVQQVEVYQLCQSLGHWAHIEERWHILRAQLKAESKPRAE